MTVEEAALFLNLKISKMRSIVFRWTPTITVPRSGTRSLRAS
jgi:hypothetical protein